MSKVVKVQKGTDKYGYEQSVEVEDTRIKVRVRVRLLDLMHTSEQEITIGPKIIEFAKELAEVADRHLGTKFAQFLLKS